MSPRPGAEQAQAAGLRGRDAWADIVVHAFEFLFLGELDMSGAAMERRNFLKTAAKAMPAVPALPLLAELPRRSRLRPRMCLRRGRRLRQRRPW